MIAEIKFDGLVFKNKTKNNNKQNLSLIESFSFKRKLKLIIKTRKEIE